MLTGKYDIREKHLFWYPLKPLSRFGFVCAVNARVGSMLGLLASLQWLVRMDCGRGVWYARWLRMLAFNAHTKPPLPHSILTSHCSDASSPSMLPTRAFTAQTKPNLDFILILIFNKLFKFKTSNEWQILKDGDLYSRPKFATGVKHQFHQGFWPDQRSGNPNHPSPPVLT